MKKLYSIALAAAVALSAAAGNHTLRGDMQSIRQIAPQKHESEIASKGISLKKVGELENRKYSNKARQEDGSYTIEGQYILTIGDYYFQESVGGSVDINVTIEFDTYSTTNIWICDEEYEWFLSDIPATYNALRNTITISKYEFGALSGYYVALVPFRYTTGISPTNAITGTFDPTTGEIDFGVDYGVGWGAFTDATYTNRAGWFQALDLISAVSTDAEPLDEEQAGQWETVGTARVAEAWVTTAYSMGGVGLNPADYEFEAELQQNVNNPKLLRLWKPFTTPEFPLYSYNTSKYDGQIVFDISDPDHVIVKPGMPAGYNLSGELYVFNYLGWQINYIGWENKDEYWDVILNFMIENEQSFDTYDAASGIVTINESVFDINKKCESAYSWNGVEYTTTTIKLPSEFAGTNNVISIEAADNQIEYFNLQGVRVANPEKGQLVIKRQGSEATKMIVK